MSEQAGDETIEKRSQGESRGGKDSSSSNFDVMGRKLLTTDEVSRLKDKCVCMIKGEYPVMDEKWNYYTKHKKIRKEVQQYGEFEYNVQIEKEGERQYTVKHTSAYTNIKENSLDYYKRCRDRGENIEIYKMDYDAFLFYDFETKKVGDLELLKDLQESFASKVEPDDKKQSVQEQVSRSYPKTDKEAFYQFILSDQCDKEQLEALKKGRDTGLNYKQLMKLINKNLDAEKLHLIMEILKTEEQK